MSSTTLQQHNSNISPLANQTTNPNENSTNSNLNNNNSNAIINLGRSSTTSIVTNSSLNNNNEFDSNKQKLLSSSSKLNNATKSKSFSTLTTNNNSSISSNNLGSSIRRSATVESDATSRRSVQLSNENFQFEIVDKPIYATNLPTPTSLQKNNRFGSVSTRPASTFSNGSVFSLTSPLLNYLQYGDVLIKCNATA